MQGNLTRYVEDELASAHAEQLCAHYPRDEVARRFDTLEEWIGRYHKTNHDGTVLTPALTRYLSRKSRFEPLLDHLSHLRDETRNGRFQLSDTLQRDLEFRRFEYEYTRVLEPLTYELQGRCPAPLSTMEIYRIFNDLEELSIRWKKNVVRTSASVRKSGALPSRPPVSWTFCRISGLEPPVKYW